YDGRQASVTYPFEAIGWTGLLVEPGPAAYEACKRHRPNSTVVNAAVSKKNSTGFIDFVEVKSPTQAHSGTRSHITTAATPKRIPGEDKLVRTKVPLTTMDEAVKFHPGRIDFAVIDVEGHEPELFDGFDLERLRPRALLVEEYPLGSRPELFSMLKSRGYEPVGTIGWNRILVHRDETELMQRAKLLQLDMD
ncbi:MAG: FkbM family methyltransferase, partial [Phycisphaerales bacterium]